MRLIVVAVLCAGLFYLAQESRAQLTMSGVGGGFGGTAGSIATNSLSFVAASSQYLNATGKTGINQQKLTFACWFKTSTATVQFFFSFSDGTVANRVLARLNASGTITLLGQTASSSILQLTTTATFNDGNWHSLVASADTTQATSTNRAAIWVDGIQINAFSIATYPSQNANLSNNFAATYVVGAASSVASFFNGNLAQVYYIDGQQLPPSSFITGMPGVPKTYSGTYAGAFDFFLPFSNGTSTTTLGADGSGEGNNWTLNAMTTANQSIDHP
jgi:hypothetical protein